MSLTDADVRKVVDGIAESAAKGRDPYRTSIQFIAGALVFTLGLVAAIVSALPKTVPGAASTEILNSAVVHTLGGVLASSSLAIATMVLSALLLQRMRRRYQRVRDQGGMPVERSGWATFLMVLAVAPGLGAVYYALLGGAALLWGWATLPAVGEVGGRLGLGSLW